MGKTMKYQGNTIQSAPQYISNWELWQLRIVISVDDHLDIRAREVPPRSCIRPSRKPISMGSPWANASLMGR
jgi:hypothetical protein